MARLTYGNDVFGTTSYGMSMIYKCMSITFITTQSNMRSLKIQMIGSNQHFNFGKRKGCTTRVGAISQQPENIGVINNLE